MAPQTDKNKHNEAILIILWGHCFLPSPSSHPWFLGQIWSPCRPTSAPALVCLPPWWRLTASTRTAGFSPSEVHLQPEHTSHWRPLYSAYFDLSIIRRGLVKLLSQLGRELSVPEGALSFHHHLVSILTDDHRWLGDIAHLSRGKTNTCQQVKREAVVLQYVGQTWNVLAQISTYCHRNMQTNAAANT